MTTKEILKQLRKERGLTAQQVAEGAGISFGVYKTYESGQRNLGIPALIKLADYYSCSADYILGRDAPAPMTWLQSISQDESLTSLERTFLTAYFSAESRELRTRLCEMVKNAAAAVDRPDIVETIGEDIDNIIPLPLASLPTSAGTGAYINDNEMIDADFYANEYTDLADFVVRISGDSMEDTFADGDYVLIHRCDVVEFDRVGLFFHDGAAYIKRLIRRGRRVYLHSDNPAYKDIPVHELYTFGEVLGTVRIAHNL